MGKKQPNPAPQFRYDGNAGRYRIASGPGKGRFVKQESVDNALGEYIDNKIKGISSLANDLRNHKITLDEFAKVMQEDIRKGHLVGGALAVGGKQNMTPSHYGQIGNVIKREIKGKKGLHRGFEGLLNDMANGMPLDGQWEQRLRQYLEAAWNTYHEIQTKEYTKKGFTEERSIRLASDSCNECVDIETLGWVPIGSTPAPGNRECLRHCRCTKRYRKTIAGKGKGKARKDKVIKKSSKGNTK